MTSASRIEPPGWITARMPASAAASMPSRNGKKASEAITLPLTSSFASAAFNAAISAGVLGTSDPEMLWQAALETFKFAGTSSEDPLTGVVVTNWYSPPSKPSERLRVSVFILSRALRSDSLSVTVDRQVRSGAGGWSDAPISREAVSDLENAVLLRARQIHAERYRNENYN